MRIDLSREEETKMLPSNSVDLVSMNTFQEKLVERIGCRAQPKTYESIKEFLEFIFENVEQFLPESKDDENKVLSDEFVSNEIKVLKKFNLQTSPSGVAGFAGLIYCIKNKLLDVNNESRVLIFISEGESDE